MVFDIDTQRLRCELGLDGRSACHPPQLIVGDCEMEAKDLLNMYSRKTLGEMQPAVELLVVAHARAECGSPNRCVARQPDIDADRPRNPRR